MSDRTPDWRQAAAASLAQLTCDAYTASKTVWMDPA